MSKSSAANLIPAASVIAALVALAAPAGGVAAETTYRAESLGRFPIGGFPVGIAQTPVPGDDRLFVAAQNGRIFVREEGEWIVPAFLNITALLTTEGERGLLGFAFHPGYGTSNAYFFVHHTDLAGDTVLARYEASPSDPNAADPASRKVLLTVPQDSISHNGGAIAFGPDGALYISVGDGNGANDPYCRAQDLSTRLGKILRIDVDQSPDAPPWHGVPADNPFLDDPSIPDDIWAYGLRNAWRLSFDRGTGDLWIADVGQFNWEEVNRVDPATAGGSNFGWPVMEGLSCNPATATFEPACDAGGIPLPDCFDPSLVDPIHVYRTGADCAVTGGFVYRGSALPELVGHYIFGDFCSGRVWALDPADPMEKRKLLRLTGDFGMTTFGEDREGEIYFNLGSEIFMLVEDPTSVEDWIAYD